MVRKRKGKSGAGQKNSDSSKENLTPTHEVRREEEQTTPAGSGQGAAGSLEECRIQEGAQASPQSISQDTRKSGKRRGRGKDATGGGNQCSGSLGTPRRSGGENTTRSQQQEPNTPVMAWGPRKTPQTAPHRPLTTQSPEDSHQVGQPKKAWSNPHPQQQRSSTLLNEFPPMPGMSQQQYPTLPQKQYRPKQPQNPGLSPSKPRTPNQVQRPQLSVWNSPPWADEQPQDPKKEQMPGSQGSPFRAWQKSAQNMVTSPRGTLKKDAYNMKHLQKNIGDAGEYKGPTISRGLSIVPLPSVMVRTLGTRGRKIKVFANYFPLKLGELNTAIHYDVTFEPEKPKSYLRAAYENFRKKHFPDRYPAFDGAKNLYSSQRPLPFGDSIEGHVEVLTPEEAVFRCFITIRRVATVDMSVVRTYLETQDEKLMETLNLQEPLQCVDIVLKQAVVDKFITAGRSYFSPSTHVMPLGDGMQLYKGFYMTSVLGWRPFVNVDVAHKAFPISGNVVEVMNQLYNPAKPYQFRSMDVEAFMRHMVGIKIKYQCPGDSKKVRHYKVNGSGDSADRTTFSYEDKMITIVDYLRRAYNYVVKFPNLKTLMVGRRDSVRKTFLVPELCYIVEHQVINRKLTDQQTRSMIKYAAGSTEQRKRNIMQSIHSANFKQNPTLKEFGFKIGDQFEKVSARVLEPPSLEYKSQVYVSKGTWNCSRFHSPVQISSWTIMKIYSEDVQPNILYEFHSKFESKARTLGMEMAEVKKPFPIIMKTSQKFNSWELSKQLRERFVEMLAKKHQLIICVIPSNNDAVYGLVKKIAEVDTGCLTQCIKSSTFRKINDSTLTNILLKVNAKLNGTNHIISPSCMPKALKDLQTMIMGADVTHPAPDARNSLSVAAVTASCDATAFSYNICWRLQHSHVEIIGDLEEIVKEQLRYWYKKNQAMKPAHIIFYRDGVSDGQFKEVLDIEKKAIKNACKSMQSDYDPKITFLVVQKRHHTRFFPENPSDSQDKNGNVPVGTCVDQTITSNRAQDFFLVSHASIQGVARPTKYRTLCNEKNMHEDDLEELTYYLCHMFARCTRSVSYPAPTYYAHLAAARAKVYYENGQLASTVSPLRGQETLKVKDCIIKKLPMYFV